MYEVLTPFALAMPGLSKHMAADPVEEIAAIEIVIWLAAQATGIATATAVAILSTPRAYTNV